MATFSRRERAMASVGLGAAVVYQVYVVGLAVWRAPAFESLYSDLGRPLPPTAHAFFVSCPYWWVVPLVFVRVVRGLRIVDLVRRPCDRRFDLVRALGKGL
jgi:hypothetical protein